MEKFTKLNLSENLMRVIKELGFTEPSEIQEKSIPLVLAGKDVLGESATGSGKTLAFGVAIIENLKHGNGVQSLILTPTRELAEQDSTSLKRFSRYNKLNITEVYGGVSIIPQIDRIKHADVIVGTPGRILDHLQRGTLNLSKVSILVLDEADRMLEMGFIDDVDKIISQVPKKRQTLLFSATISSDIDHLSKKYMVHPVKVSAVSYVDPSKLQQVFYDVPPFLKFSLLVHLLKNEKSHLAMIFTNTRNTADMIEKNLKRYRIDAMAIHGGHAQNKRSSILKSFQDNALQILVCTDVAARGLDIKNVSHVYNYDIPKTSTEYIHRIGRTARAGNEGMAVNIVSAKDYDNFNRVIEDKSLKIKQLELPEMEKLDVNMFAGRTGGGRFSGGRGNSNFRNRGRDNDRSPREGGSRRNYGGRSFSGGSQGGRSYGNRESRGGSDNRSSYGQRSYGSDTRRSYGNRSQSSGDGRKSYGSRGRDNSRGNDSRGFGGRNRR
ncbi:ATP-dependent helicase [Candidatus Pacearchaeota archaeon CG10_big_fil_rev_8_21_14_0_10_32_14]|nr:MAG: ATP-dependent helicase [Candidatus Pacearchaeota archaeon CG10_big_fil_rev_8_21_14_0_10_32_14]